MLDGLIPDISVPNCIDPSDLVFHQSSKVDCNTNVLRCEHQD